MSRIAAFAQGYSKLSRPVLLAARLSAAVSLRRQRQALSRLDAERLADIGVTRDEAAAESARPVWDVPATWRL